jgi:glutathione S-transferase
MTLVHLVIALALVEFFVFLNAVGRARDTYHVPAPATTGNEVFERYFRVQMNTLEQLIIFVPAILLFARYVHPLVAAALGLVFILGRWLYFRAYVRDPKRRGTGFLIAVVPNSILLLGGLIGALITLIRYPGVY